MYLDYNGGIGVGWTQLCDVVATADVGCTRLRRPSSGGAWVHVSHSLLLGAVG